MTSPLAATRPSSDDVLLRAASLRIVTLHAMRLLPALPPLRSARDLPAEQFAEFRAQMAAQHAALRRQLEEAGLWTAMTPAEHRFIETLPFDLEPQQAVRALFECEAATVLLWALELRDELPAYGQPSDPAWLEAVASPPARVQLRPQSAVERAREIAAAWHWRSRTRQLMAMGQPLPAATGYQGWEALIHHSAETAVQDGLLASSLDGDYPVGGRPYHALPEAEWQTLAQITEARHRALNWLSGLAPGNHWDETPTAT
jgi:hypothetical protein